MHGDQIFESDGALLLRRRPGGKSQDAKAHNRDAPHCAWHVSSANPARSPATRKRHMIALPSSFSKLTLRHAASLVFREFALLECGSLLPLCCPGACSWTVFAPHLHPLNLPAKLPQPMP